MTLSLPPFGHVIPADCKWCILCDIDGTIADNRHRAHFLTGKPKRWREFFDAMPGDAPINHMLALLGMFSDYWPSLGILLVTGRPKTHRRQTIDWLARHHVAYDGLYMREAEDYRDDTVIKAELLARIRAYKYEPWLVFDDRDKVVKMWREQGLPCFQVADGDF